MLLLRKFLLIISINVLKHCGALNEKRVELTDRQDYRLLSGDGGAQCWWSKRHVQAEFRCSSRTAYAELEFLPRGFEGGG